MEPLDRAGLHRLAIATGIVWLVLGAAGVLHGTLVAVSQGLYHHAKYGAARNDLPRALVALETAHRLYPQNFFAASHVADRAWHRAEATPEPDARERLLQVSELWCRRGLSLNPYDRSLRLRWTALLARTDLRAAIRYQETFVEWHFWHPWNHAVLAALYARAGDFDRAEQALFWVRQNRDFYAAARADVARAKEAFFAELQGRTDAGAAR